MKEIFEIVKKNSLFKEIDFKEFNVMFDCLSAAVKNYKKKENILLSGDEINFVGIVLKGKVQIIKEDLNGNQSILTEILPSELFGEVFACAGIFQSPVTITASEDSTIMFFDFRKVIENCKNTCVFHNKLIENMLQIIAHKNLFLNQKVDILSKRSIREKLFCFFDHQNQAKFTINFNREELSKYLCVDRSALSAELSKMQKEGLIKYNKNYFERLK